MSQLAGRQLKQLHEALLDSFRSHSELNMMLRFELNESLDYITAGNTMNETVFDVIQWAERMGRTRELIDAARSQNPGNPRLAAFIESYHDEAVIEPTSNSTELSTKAIIENGWDNLTEELDLSNRNLSILPPEIGGLTRLRVLNLSGNELSELPSEIGLLTNLVSLNLSGNKLSSLPDTLVALQNLEILDLSRNRLDVVPAQISLLTALNVLNLNENTLVELPSGLNRLSRLQSLDLNTNQLSSLPSSFEQLQQLTSFNLALNRFSTFPNVLTKLQSLRELNFSDNQLPDIPNSFANLGYLEELNLGANKITVVPQAIIETRTLNWLNLQGNQITEIPLEIINLNRLGWINLEDNPIKHLPDFLTLSGDPARLFSFLQEQAQAIQKPLLEAKIIVAGEASVGKTSLVNRLVHDSFSNTEETTLGIAITPWRLTANNSRINVNIWDFGGQEIMHATHQFFMTKRSVYVVVIDSRSGENESRLEHWLKLIRSFAGNSPIIVVCNKADQNRIDLNITALERKYGISKPVHLVSCKTPFGIEEVHSALQKAVGLLQHVHDPIPAKWFAVKSQIEALEQDYITYESYVEIAAQNGVDTSDSHDNLLSFLHDLGIVLWFGDDPRLLGTNVLNPEWVTSAVYRILTSSVLFEQNGRLNFSQLKDILPSTSYPKTQYGYIVDVMKRFELCFSFQEDGEEQLLIPDLLPKNEPFTGEWTDSLAFQLQYDVLPAAVISRFIVRMKDNVHQDTLWRSGAVLKYQDVLALVSADMSESKIHIHVSGDNEEGRRFLEVIRSTFRAIHRTVSNITASEWVPIPDTNSEVSYEALLQNERHGIEQFVPPGMQSPVSVSKLLRGIDPPEMLSRQIVSGPREFATPIPEPLRGRLSELTHMLSKIPSTADFTGRSGLLFGITNTDGLNRNTASKLADMRLLIDQLWNVSLRFDDNHPVAIMIDNALAEIGEEWDLQGDLSELRTELAQLYKEPENV